MVEELGFINSAKYVINDNETLLSVELLLEVLEIATGLGRGAGV
ncbi:MAG: hypothetical protein ACOCZX_05955 [Candidatus Bipolaricaulota bacterium]